MAVKGALPGGDLWLSCCALAVKECIFCGEGGECRWYYGAA